MKFLKRISLYTFIGFVGAGINFFLMPYLSHFLSPADYGIIALFNSFVTIIIPLVGLAASGLIVVEYYKIKDRQEYASLFSSVQFIPIPLAIFFLVALFPFFHSIARFIELPASKSYWIPLSIVLSLLTINYETLLAYNVIEEKPFRYGLYSLTRVLVEVALTIWFVSGLRMGWEGRLLSWMLSATLSCLLSILYFHKQGLLTTNIKRKYVLAAVNFGLPLILHTIGKFIINQSDRLFIAKMISLEESGIYNIGYQVGMLLLLVVNAIVNFYSPFLYSRLSDGSEKAKIEIVKMSYMLVALMLFLLIMLTLGAPLFFKYFVDKSYAGATPFVFWIGLSYFFWGIYIIFTGFVFYFKKTRLLGILAVVNVILNIVLNYVLIKFFGALGAAYATCISFFVTAVVIAYAANKLIPMPWLRLRYVFGRSKTESVIH